jgi:hypothetical protein
MQEGNDGRKSWNIKKDKKKYVVTKIMDRYEVSFP